MTLNMRCKGSDSNIYIYAWSHEKSERIKVEVVKPTRGILLSQHHHCSSSNKRTTEIRKASQHFCFTDELSVSATPDTKKKHLLWRGIRLKQVKIVGCVYAMGRWLRVLTICQNWPARPVQSFREFDYSINQDYIQPVQLIPERNARQWWIWAKNVEKRPVFYFQNERSGRPVQTFWKRTMCPLTGMSVGAASNVDNWGDGLTQNPSGNWL